MPSSLYSGCLNHPAIEAVARCRQCGKPVCGKCVIKAQNGMFCCEECREKYTEFTQRAQKLDEREKATVKPFFFKVRRLLLRLCFLLGLAAAAYFAYSWISANPDAVKNVIPASLQGNG